MYGYPQGYRYPGYSYDDTWVRHPPNNSPNRGTRPLAYEDDYWTTQRHAYPQYQYQWPGAGGMYPIYASPFPPSPTYLASLVPLPPSHHNSPYSSPRLAPVTPVHISPRLAPVALAPVAGPQYLLPIDPAYYIPNAQPQNYGWPANAPRSVHIHPYLNGESSRLEVVLDLTASTLRPMLRPQPNQPNQPPANRWALNFNRDNSNSNSNANLNPIHPAYLSQTATYPATTRMHITCPALAPYSLDWEIHVSPSNSASTSSPNPNYPQGPGITVSDVLSSIHASLQTKISHPEWARLPESVVFEVSKAYTRRCRSSSAYGSAAEFERNQGVRRVDFLGDRFMFGGLVRVKEGDNVHFRLNVKGV